MKVPDHLEGMGIRFDKSGAMMCRHLVPLSDCVRCAPELEQREAALKPKRPKPSRQEPGDLPDAPTED